MPPVGAVFVAFFAVAVPVILLMTVWATVTALRILFPERGLPSEAGRRALGEGVPVRLRDIVAEQEARRARAAKPRVEDDRDAAAPAPRAHPLFEDLWIRRN